MFVNNQGGGMLTLFQLGYSTTALGLTFKMLVEVFAD